MKTSFRSFIAFVPLALGLLASPLAHAGDAVIGGLIGGGAGALIGQQIGGRDGAIIGGALGAATGVYVANDSPRYRSPPPRRAYVDAYGPRVFIAPPPPVYYVPAGRGWHGPDHRRQQLHHSGYYNRHDHRQGGRNYDQYDGRGNRNGGRR